LRAEQQIGIFPHRPGTRLFAWFAAWSPVERWSALRSP